MISICKCTLLKSKMTQSRGKGAFELEAGRSRPGGAREPAGSRPGGAPEANHFGHQFATVSGIKEVNRSTWSIKKQKLETVSGNKQIWSSNTKVGGEGYSS